MSSAGHVHVHAVLRTLGLPDPLTVQADETPCQGAEFHSPSPLTTQRYTDDGWQHLDSDVEIWLCPTCYENLRVLVHLMDSIDPEWVVLREFGNALRALARTVTLSRLGREVR